MSDADQEPTFSVGWRGAVGMAVCLAAAVGTAVVWSSDSAERTGGDGSAAAPGAVTGQDLFHAKGCAGCHRGPDAADDFIGLAPDLTDVAAWAGQRREGLSAEEYLAESIRDPGAFTSPAFQPGSAGPMNAMPDLEVSEAEIELIVTYLLSDQR